MSTRIINESKPNFIHNSRNIILSMQKNLDMYYPFMNHILRQIPKNEEPNRNISNKV
jgi:hypothetical protein